MPNKKELVVVWKHIPELLRRKAELERANELLEIMMPASPVEYLEEYDEVPPYLQHLPEITDEQMEDDDHNPYDMSFPILED